MSSLPPPVEPYKVLTPANRYFSSMDEYNRDYGVHVYCDLNTTPLPSDFVASTFLDKINTTIQRVEHKYFLKRVGIYGNLDAYPGLASLMDDQSRDESSFYYRNLMERGVQCGPCKDIVERLGADRLRGPNLPAKKNLPHFLLKQDLYSNTFLEKPPYTILLITGDACFVNAMEHLKERGFKILLAHPKDSDPSHKAAADFSITCDKMF